VCCREYIAFVQAFVAFAICAAYRQYNFICTSINLKKSIEKNGGHWRRGV